MLWADSRICGFADSHVGFTFCGRYAERGLGISSVFYFSLPQPLVAQVATGFLLFSCFCFLKALKSSQARLALRLCILLLLPNRSEVELTIGNLLMQHYVPPYG